MIPKLNSKAKGLLSGTSFKQSFLLLLLFVPLKTLLAQGTNLVEILGKVIDQDKKPLPSVSVQIKGTIAGTITNNEGDFTLRTKSKFPLNLVFSSIGFQPQEFLVEGVGSKIAIELITQTMLGKDVVVSASRVAENILKSPVA